jgi:hypothetical protein
LWNKEQCPVVFSLKKQGSSCCWALCVVVNFENIFSKPSIVSSASSGVFPRQSTLTTEHTFSNVKRFLKDLFTYEWSLH